MNEHEQKKIASEIVLKARAECRKKNKPLYSNWGVHRRSN